MKQLKVYSLAERAWRVYELDESDVNALTAREQVIVFALALLTVAWLALLAVGAFALAASVIAWIAG
jgi:thiamine monophosphate kinase